MGDKTGIESLFGEPLPRRCRGRGETKPITGFNVDASRPDGHGYLCRSCGRVSPVEVPNRVERAQARRVDELAWCRRCARWHPASVVTKQGLCSTHQREEDRERYAHDPEHRLRRRAHSTRRRRGVEPVPPIGMECLTEEFEGRCAYCPSLAATWDHVIPVSKGGLTTPDNILPSCVPCNSSKRDRDLDAWLEGTGRTLSVVAAERLSHFQVLPEARA